jgi:hypothetical protein
MQGKIGHVQRQFISKQDAIRKNIMRRLNPTSESRPVFLVGCGRSGTSMLVWQLEKSWQVQLYNEDHPAAFDNYRFRSPAVIESLLTASRAPITLFKPILDTVQTPFLLDRFLNGKAVFVFRHYNDVINSSLKKFGTNNRINHVRDWMENDFAEFDVAPPLETTKRFIRDLWRQDLSAEEGAALYWLFYNRLFTDLGLQADPRVLLICYETLVTNADDQFRRLITFLEAQWEERFSAGVFSSSINKHKAPNICAEISAACDALYAQLVEDAG